MNCRNITYYSVVVPLLTETGLQYFTFCYQIRETNFSLLRKISPNAMQSLLTDAFLRTWIFTDINFSEPFRVPVLGLLSGLEVRIINHMIIFLSYFPFPSSFFYGFGEKLFKNFWKITMKKQDDGVYIFSQLFNRLFFLFETIYPSLAKNFY